MLNLADGNLESSIIENIVYMSYTSYSLSLGG